MTSIPPDLPAVLPARRPGTLARARDGAAAEAAVTELYRAHALGLTRLAHAMLGDRAGAEDVVHEAFIGLYRRWDRLDDQRKAPQYLRSSVLNGCRSELRRGGRRRLRPDSSPDGRLVERAQIAQPSAEASVLADEDRHVVLAAIMRLPGRQREVLVLRYYLEEPDAVIAGLLGIASGTVRSTAHRALAALATDLRERS